MNTPSVKIPKYAQQQHPPYMAKNHISEILIGNDGNYWQSQNSVRRGQDKQGRMRWKYKWVKVISPEKNEPNIERE